MSRLTQDLRIAARALIRARFVSILALTAFALGTGVTTAVFSIFNGVLLKPLPYPAGDRIVAVYDTQPACKTCPASFPKFHDWKSRNQVFSAIGGSTQSSFVLTGHGDAVRVAAASTTASLVDVFGVHPVTGRWFSEQEDRAGGPKVVVVTHEFWTSRLASEPAVLGRTLLFDGEPYEVIGVMPPGFSHRRAEVFVPLQRRLDPATRGSHFLSTWARLKDGVAIEQATADMRELGHTLAREFGHNHGIDVRSYTEVVVGNVRRPLAILLGAVFLVLLIACANVANLLLAAGVARRRELAVRLALGARLRDLALQLTTESVLLAAAGGLLGVLLAWWTVRLFVALAANQLPRADSIAIDGAVLAFSAAVTLGVGVFSGAWPLVLLRTRQLAAVVREGDTRTASGTGRGIGNALVVAEIAVACTLLVGAGLLVKNLLLLQGRDTGMRTERIVSFEVAPSGPRYRAPEQRVAYFRELHARIAQVDLIERTGMTSHLPMFSFGWNGEYQIEGGTPWGPNDAPLVENRWFYGDYFATLGVPLRKGRMLDERDRQGTRTVLVNEAMAGKFWPGKDPVGRRFGQGRDASQWFEVVGVIGNIRSFGLDRAAPYEFYRSIEQSGFGAMTVVMRSRAADPISVMAAVRPVVASIDPTIPVTRVQTLEQVVADSVGQPRLLSALTGLFGGLAGLLAMVGVYGVMAYNVRRQRREFGIRLALGASQRTVHRLVVGRGLLLGVAGVAIGGFGAWLLTGLLRTMLHDVTPTDPAVFAGVALTVLLVTTAASSLPARAAGRVDPMVALREE